MISATPVTCCGCSSCMTVCPKGAITMRQNEKGAYVPYISQELCIDCGLCDKACSFTRFQPTGKLPEAYAARMKDPEEVLTSRSGGFFMAICRLVIDRGGVVFGCQLDENFHVAHRYETTYEGCRKFKGSKYVESDMGECFRQCIDFLKAGKTVLFSGTGCQIHGLLQCLKVKNIPTENLVTIDIVCHGAPTAGVWQAYKNVIEDEEQSGLKQFVFRDKTRKGWEHSVSTYRLKNGKQKEDYSWTRLYYSCATYRDSCYHCVYTTTQRLTDFTIADYWGIENNAPRFNDDKGVSLVLVHTENAARYLEEAKTYLDWQKTKLETSIQPQLCSPKKRGEDYKRFWRIWRRSPRKAIRYLTNPTVFHKAVRKIKRGIRKIFR